MEALVFSSHTNAYAIFKSLDLVGIDCATTDRNPTFPIPSKKYATEADWLFFTEEASLRRALTGELKGRYLPRAFPLELLDDKWAFVQWLSSNERLTGGLKQWKLSELNQASMPCLLKAKHSWVGHKKLPRGWICHSEQEVEENINSLKMQGLDSNHFFLQEWVGDLDCRVISVCGFHDTDNNNRNLIAVVERIASYTKGLSCSAAIQTIPDDWGLVAKTYDILNELHFTGPFEMEYLVVGERVVVLELNPRFWMQHSIFLKHNNGLVKRYLNLDTKDDWGRDIIPNTVWIDSIHLIKSIARLNFNFLRFVSSLHKTHPESILLWPSIPIVVFAAVKKSLSKLITRSAEV